MELWEEYNNYISNVNILNDFNKNIQIYLNELNMKNTYNELYAYFDADMFFASCEVKKNPFLKDKAFFVGAKAVCCSNYHARKLGINSGMNYFNYKDIIENNKLIILESDLEYYKSESKKMMNFLEEKFKKINQKSIDELYLNITELIEYYKLDTDEKLFQYFNDLKDEIYFKFKHTFTIGISFNPLLSKICCSFGKPNGIFIKSDKNTIEEFIDNLEIRKMPGFGNKTTILFKSLNFNKITDLKNNLNFLYFLYKNKNKKFKNLLYKIYGYSDSEEYEQVKSISKSRSITNSFPNKIYGIIRDICRKLYRKLIKKKLLFKQLIFDYKNENFKTFTRSFNLIEHTNDLNLLMDISIKIFEDLNENIKYRNISIRLNNLVYDGKIKFKNQNIVDLFKNEKLFKRKNYVEESLDYKINPINKITNYFR